MCLFTLIIAFFGQMYDFAPIETLLDVIICVLHLISSIKDSFITQDRNDDFEGVQVESTFS